MSNYKDGGFFGTLKPLCPYCGELQPIDNINNLFEDFLDEETVNFTCGFCGKSIYVQLDVIIRYNTFL
jgi:predicted RNA-binding Zn-ribbon protein involved in translation (DUF1610 family)